MYNCKGTVIFRFSANVLLKTREKTDEKLSRVVRICFRCGRITNYGFEYSVSRRAYKMYGNPWRRDEWEGNRKVFRNPSPCLPMSLCVIYRSYIIAHVRVFRRKDFSRYLFCSLRVICPRALIHTCSRVSLAACNPIVRKRRFGSNFDRDNYPLYIIVVQPPPATRATSRIFNGFEHLHVISNYVLSIRTVLHKIYA